MKAQDERKFLHDISTPLAALLIFIDLLREETQSAHVGKAAELAEKLKQLVEARRKEISHEHPETDSDRR